MNIYLRYTDCLIRPLKYYSLTLLYFIRPSWDFGLILKKEYTLSFLYRTWLIIKPLYWYRKLTNFLSHIGVSDPQRRMVHNSPPELALQKTCLLRIKLEFVIYLKYRGYLVCDRKICSVYDRNAVNDSFCFIFWKSMLTSLLTVTFTTESLVSIIPKTKSFGRL